MIIRLIIILILMGLFVSCSKNKEEIYNPSKPTDPYKLYNEGLEAFKVNNFFSPIKNFQRQNSILLNQN